MATQALVYEHAPPREPIAPERGRILELRRHQVELGGVLVDRVDFTTAVERLRGFLRSGEPHQVCTVNLDFISIAERDPRFRDTVNQAHLAVPDGMPLVWVSRL